MIPEPVAVPTPKRDDNVDLRANPACFGTDPNLMNCECQLVYEALVRSVMLFIGPENNYGNCPLCGSPLYAPLVWCEHCQDDVCDNCRERHTDEAPVQ